MARGKLTHPITPDPLRAQGVSRKEYCAYLDTLAHYEARATVNRATAGQPASPRLSATQPDPIHSMGGR
jgi:hypothetical protein